MYADVMLAVGLSCHVHGDAGVAARVRHLGVFDLQQPALVQDLGALLARDRPAVFQPGDRRSWDALGGALQGHVASFYHGAVVAVALAASDGRAD